MKKLPSRLRCAAFSLVELLISLIIISLIVAAFAPIMTKKLSNNALGGAGGISDGNKSNFEELLLKFGDSSQEDLFECFKNSSETVTNCVFTVPKLVTEISAVIAGGGGGGAGGVSMLTVDKDVEIVTNSGKLEDSIKIVEGMANVRVADLIGGGGAGGASFVPGGGVKKTIMACPDKTILATANDGSKYCITKFNVRPKDIAQYHGYAVGNEYFDPEMSSTMMEIKVDTTGLGFKKGAETVAYNSATMESDPACTTRPYLDARAKPGASGTAACSDNVSMNSDGYVGCGRTICNWNAAVLLCAALDIGENTCSDDGVAFDKSCKGKWRLPNEKEIFTNNDSNYLLKNASGKLNFCGVNQCFVYQTFNPCKGVAYGGDCDANVVWGEKRVGNIQIPVVYQRYSYETNSFPPSYAAASVRCLIRMSDPVSVNSFGGGGGAAGASISSEITIDNSIIQNNIGAEIKLKAGKGASLTANSVAEYSQVTVEKNSKILWGYRVYGGANGNDATESGAGGASSATTKCEQYENNIWAAITCPYQGAQGKAGTAVYANDGTKTASGGAGGATNYNLGGYKYGTGGKGASASAMAVKDNESGKAGYVRVLYDISSPGTSGGGGSGACVARIEKIRVKPQTQLKIKIGAGGKGGNIALNGADGNETSIEYPSVFKFAVSGGFGGKTGIAAKKEGGIIVEASNGEETKEGECITTSDLVPASFGEGIIFRYAGKKGTGGKNDITTKNAMGGIGGVSGFSEISGFPYLFGGCGGYYNEECFNNNRNGLSAPSYEPSRLYATEDYGTFGFGGGGGGWKYDLAGTQPAGVGGNGLDGFVYLYWRKVGK